MSTITDQFLLIQDTGVLTNHEATLVRRTPANTHTCTHPGCGRQFNRRYTLDEHTKTHTGEKPHVCPVRTCNKSFSTSGNLSRHKRLHSYIEPLSCPIAGCVCTFSSNNKLSKHMRFHFGSDDIKVCVVSGCGKTFSTTGNLNRHLKASHNGSYDFDRYDNNDIVDSTNDIGTDASAKCVTPLSSSVTACVTSNSHSHRNSPAAADEWTPYQHQLRTTGYFEPETMWTSDPLRSASGSTLFQPPTTASFEDALSTDVVDVLATIFGDLQQPQYHQHDEANIASSSMTTLMNCSVDIFQNSLQFGVPFTSYHSY